MSTTRPLELLHIDLCVPMRTKSLNYRRYVLVIVDDYSRFTWTVFLKSKDETFEQFEALMKKTQRNWDSWSQSDKTMEQNSRMPSF